MVWVGLCRPWILQRLLGAVLRPWTSLGGALADCSVRPSDGVPLDLGTHSGLDLARTEDHSGPKLLNGIVQGKLDGAVILDDTNLGPGGALAGEHGSVHKLWGRVGEHAREIGVGDLWEDGDVARIFLAQDGYGLGQ